MQSSTSYVEIGISICPFKGTGKEIDLKYFDKNRTVFTFFILNRNLYWFLNSEDASLISFHKIYYKKRIFIREAYQITVYHSDTIYVKERASPRVAGGLPKYTSIDF